MSKIKPLCPYVLMSKKIKTLYPYVKKKTLMSQL